MDHTQRFRSYLTKRLLFAACLAASPMMGCETTIVRLDEGDDAGGAGGTTSRGGAGGDWTTSNGGFGNTSWTETQCFEWPADDGPGGGGPGGGAPGGAGPGGSGNVGGAGVGGAGVGGAGVGGAGVGGAGEPPPCPDVNEANPYLPDTQIGCGWATQHLPGVQGPGECCYEVSFDCGVGRPYTHDGGSLSADARWGVASTWSDQHDAPTDALTPAARSALARAWSADGMYEHASVASFGRFAMELMAVGAPPALVAAAHVAAADEVRHARACLSLAARYAGEAIDVGGFPFDGRVVVSSDLAEIAARAAYEGCVGETVASIQAAEQRATARDEQVRAALGQIAKEEAQHAELAWRAVAWAIERGGDEVRAAVAAAIETAVHHLLHNEPEQDHDASIEAELEAHGRLSRARVMSMRRDAIRDVVLPCAQRLLHVAPSVAHGAHEGVQHA